MFDPNLQRDKALEDIGGPAEGAVLKTTVEKNLIDLCRETSEARNDCFKSESNYRANIAGFHPLVAEYRSQLARSKPFQFLGQNFGVYANAGALQQQNAPTALHIAFTFLDETMSNAMAASDDVRTSIHITPRGVLLDIEQGQKGFDPQFLDGMKAKSEQVYGLLTQGQSIDGVISTMRSSLMKTIGYVPTGLDEKNGLPHRGNGTGNVLMNDYFRTNFTSDSSGHRTLSLHTVKQLKDAVRLQNGDLSVLNALYGPSEVPMDAGALDDLFGSGFDMKDIFK